MITQSDHHIQTKLLVSQLFSSTAIKTKGVGWFYERQRKQQVKTQEIKYFE